MKILQANISGRRYQKKIDRTQYKISILSTNYFSRQLSGRCVVQLGCANVSVGVNSVHNRTVRHKIIHDVSFNDTSTSVIVIRYAIHKSTLFEAVQNCRSVDISPSFRGPGHNGLARRRHELQATTFLLGVKQLLTNHVEPILAKLGLQGPVPGDICWLSYPGIER